LRIVVYTLSILLLAAPPYCARADPDGNGARMTLEVQQLSDCFRRGLQEARVKPSGYAQLFILDQLSAPPPDPSPSRLEQFCAETLVKPYLAAFRATEEHIMSDPSRSHTLGTPGTRPIDSDWFFIRHGQAASHAAHVAGHSDIMTSAIGKMAPP